MKVRTAWAARRWPAPSTGRGTTFPVGPFPSGDQANCNGNQPFGNARSGPWLRRPTRVGAYPATTLGLCDMHGDACQWTDTAQGSDRVDRGASWREAPAGCRASERFALAPAVEGINPGFSPARALLR
jgi:formylglycine-generating enzyme required for sulfatase activity